MLAGPCQIGGGNNSGRRPHRCECRSSRDARRRAHGASSQAASQLPAKQPHSSSLPASPDDVDTKGSCYALHGHIIQGGAHTPTGDDRLMQHNSRTAAVQQQGVLSLCTCDRARL